MRYAIACKRERLPEAALWINAYGRSGSPVLRLPHARSSELSYTLSKNHAIKDYCIICGFRSIRCFNEISN